MEDFHLSKSELASPAFFVEFVGPAGSGKSTLINFIRHHYGHEFSYVGVPQRSFLHRAKSRLIAVYEKLSLGGHDLDALSKDRLVKRFVKIHAGLEWYASCRSGIFLLDEGPLRIMMDYSSHDKKQYRVWRSFCLQALSSLTHYRVLVIFVKVRPEIRHERRKKRMGPLEMANPNFNPNYKGECLCPENLLFFREEAKRTLCGHMFEHVEMEELVNQGDVEEVATRARQLIHAYCTTEP